jgi:hypothetical protein
MPGSSKWSLSSRFLHQNPIYTFPLSHTRYVSCLSHSSRFDHPNNIGWGMQCDTFILIGYDIIKCLCFRLQPCRYSKMLVAIQRLIIGHVLVWHLLFKVTHKVTPSSLVHLMLNCLYRNADGTSKPLWYYRRLVHRCIILQVVGTCVVLRTVGTRVVLRTVGTRVVSPTDGRYVFTWLHTLLGAFVKLLRATVSFMSLSSWNKSAVTRRIFMKFGVWVFFENIYRKFEVWLKYIKNNGYFA